MRKIFALAVMLSVLLCGSSWADYPKVLAGGTKESPVVWESSAVEVLSGGWYTFKANEILRHKITLAGDVTLVIPKDVTIFYRAGNGNALNEDDGTNGSTCIIDGGDQYSLTLEGEGVIEAYWAYCYKYTNDIAEKEREATIRVKSYTQNGVKVLLFDRFYINTDPENPLHKDASFVQGVYASESVTINSGDLYTMGIRAEKNITLNGGTININRSSASNIPITASEVALSDTSFGLYAKDTLMINGGAVNPSSYSGEDVPIASLEGANNVKITGGTVNAKSTSTSNPEFRGFYIFGGRNNSEGGVDISGGTVITNYTIDGSNIAISDCIVSADSIRGSDTIAISKSTVNAGSISVDSTVTISDSTVSADSIKGDGSVTLSDSTVNSGYICAGSGFTISGGKVTVSSTAEKNGIEILDGNIAMSYSKEDDFITFSKIAATVTYNPDTGDYAHIYVPKGYTFTDDEGRMYDYDITYDTPYLLLNSTNLTLRPKKYPVRIASDITHGTVSVTPENAVPGTEIVVTVTPDEGYAVTSVRIAEYYISDNIPKYYALDYWAVNRSRENPSEFSFIMPPPYVNKTTYVLEVRATFSECFAGGTEDEPVTLDNPEVVILAGGCYAVESDITFWHSLMLQDDVTLILKDGAAINFGAENHKIARSENTSLATAVDGYNYTYHSLTIEGSGAFNVYCENTNTADVRVASYTQKGGSVYLSGYLSAGDVEISYSNAEDFIHAERLSSIKIKEGFTFTDGTNEYDSSTESDVLSALQNATLRPKDAHSVSIEAGTHVKVKASKTWYFTDDIVALDVIVDNGYEATVKFNETEITPDDDMYSFAMPAENVTITAEAEQAVYKITYSLNGGTASPSNPESYTVETYFFTLNNPTRKGYTFEGWTGTELAGITKSVTIRKGSTGDREYAAVWTPNFAHFGLTDSNTPDGTSDNPYVISTIDGWALLAGEVNNGDDYSGKTFRLDDNITAAEIIGTSVAGFAGTFDGNSKKLTFNYGGEDDCCAPFLYVDGGTIKNLTVDGTITAGGTHAGGIIGHASGKTSIDGCKFAGKILTVNDDGTIGGGFVAENSGELTVTGSIYSPAYLDNGETEADSEGSATFARSIEEGTLTITNSYYTRTLGTAQGKELHTVMADTGITVALDEDSPNGLVNDGEIIAGEGDTVILEVSGGNAEEGYTFTGYKADGNILSESDGKYTLAMPGEETIITACFEAINYSITYNLDGGSLPEGKSNPESYTVETKDFTLNNPIKTGYKFAGWSGSNGEEPEKILTITQGFTENLAYTAKWTANTYTVKFDANKGAGEMQSQEYTYGSEASAFRANTFTREGYTFSGWNTKSDGSGTSYTDGQEVTNLAAEGEITLYAQWTAITYTITYNLDGGTAQGNPASYTIESESFTLSNPTKDGYTFRGWSGTDIDDGSMTVTISEGSTGNRAYTAAWTKNGFVPKESAKPEFVYHSLILSGQIGVFFYAYIPAEYDPEKCTVDFSVSGDISQNEQGKKYSETEDVDGTRFYLYKCFINSVQMADKITATLHYGDNQSISQTYTAKEYLDTVISMEKGAISADLVELARCIKDYGCYVQPILASYNNWEIGKKHAAMDCEYTYDDTDFETADNATKAHTVSSDIPESSGIQKVEFALVLDSNTAIEVYLIPKDGYTGGVNAEGRTAAKKGGRYVVRIGNISAHKLGDIHTIKISTQYEGGPEISFNVKLSALSYVQAAIHDTRDTMKKAVTSLYRYYAATMEYRRNRPDKY